jgi:hypothetical protein
LNVAGILREQNEFTCGDVDFVKVEELDVPGVEVNDRLARPGTVQLETGPCSRERSEVDGGRVRVLQVDPVDVPVLVAVAVLGV